MADAVSFNIFDSGTLVLVPSSYSSNLAPSETNMKFLNLLMIIFVFLFPTIHMEYVSTSSPSSCECEELQNIIHDLPGSCGGKNYQLDCQGNNTILSIYSNQFLVKDISFQTKTFRLVSTCYSTPDHPSYPLPNQTISRDSIYSSFLYYNFLDNMAMINFVNCTEEIEDWDYHLIPCLNRTHSKVYAVTDLGGFPVSDLHDSCSSIGSAVVDVPFEFVGEGIIWDVNCTALMQAIGTGLLVNWTAIKTSDWFLFLSCSTFEFCWMDNRPNWKYLTFGPEPYTTGYSDLPFSWGPALASCFYKEGAPFAYSVVLTLIVLFYIVFIILVARMIIVPVAIYLFLLHKRWRITSSVSSIEKFLRKNEILRIRRYDFVEISIMTNHFKDKIGQGGFGSVYRGKFLSGQHVAVKILSTIVGDGDDFISEVASIGRIHHVNIVRLIGFCSERSKRALIYAYMPNGSLDKYIFSSSINVIPMEKRREIAIGIARGIDYLHRGCEMQILHFDIKPHNILLDNDFTPKISDFGLARLYSRDHNLVTLSMARGTIGYIAPELISRTFGAISYKADIYSFGMLLMEMASGRRNVNNHAESSSQVYYPSWIYDQLNLTDNEHNLNQGVETLEEIEEVLYKVALWCIQMRASNRPTMSKVIEMLQSNADSLEMPPRPFTTVLPQEFPVRSSEIESCSVELSVISEETSML